MTWGNNTAPDGLAVPAELLAGEIAWAKGEKAGAIAHFRQAVMLHDKIIYDEPPDWDLPTGEFLGRALLTDGRLADAEAAYRAELIKHPNNGRALYGLIESLKRQSRSDEAKKLQPDLTRAWAHADTKP